MAVYFSGFSGILLHIPNSISIGHIACTHRNIEPYLKLFNEEFAYFHLLIF